MRVHLQSCAAVGLTAGTVDVAAKAAVTASSTANGLSHGARAFLYFGLFTQLKCSK